MLNRSAIVLRPKRPFIQWVESVEKTIPKEYRIPREVIDVDQTTYLIPSSEFWNSIDEAIEDLHAELFERELLEWYEDESLWPKSRTLKMFKEWFDVQVSTMVVDLMALPLIDDSREGDSFWSKVKRAFGRG